MELTRDSDRLVIVLPDGTTDAEAELYREVLATFVRNRGKLKATGWPGATGVRAHEYPEKEPDVQGWIEAKEPRREKRRA